MTAHGRRWTAASSARRAWEVLTREGARALWFKVLGETVYRRVLLVRLDLTALPPPPPVDAFESSFLAEPDVDELAALGSPTSAAQARDRLRRGDRCFVARLDGRIVSARWVATRSPWIDYVGRAFELRPGEAYVYDTFTKPEVRGRAISSLAGMRLAHALAGEGLAALVAVVLPENASGMRTVEKAGYRPVAVVGRIGVGRLRKDFVRPSA